MHAFSTEGNTMGGLPFFYVAQFEADKVEMTNGTQTSNQIRYS